jgi:hypothetical protein
MVPHSGGKFRLLAAPVPQRCLPVSLELVRSEFVENTGSDSARQGGGPPPTPSSWLAEECTVQGTGNLAGGNCVRCQLPLTGF